MAESTATLMDDGSTLYRTNDYQEWLEAIAAAREEGAEITVQSTGSGFAAKIRYADDADRVVGLEDLVPDDDDDDDDSGDADDDELL